MTLPPQFAYRDGRLFLEDVPLAEVAARFGTPVYVYSRRAIVDAYAEYAGALAQRIAADRAMVCYAVKANGNLAILDVLARAGAGFDIVSGGELERVVAAGGDPRRVVFSGVGKTKDEMRRALDAGIACFNVESMSEARQLAAVAGDAGKRAPVSLRVNPDVDARTHPYVATGLAENKFGIAFDEALAAYRAVASMPALEIVGIDCHIGSQLTDVAPLLDALERLLGLVDRLADAGIAIAHLDVGGGVGIRYGDEAADVGIDIDDYVCRVVARVDAWERGRANRRMHHGRVALLLEPGRSIVGNAGALVTRTLVLKPGASRHFAVVDAAMNDLLRPALYDAYHAFVPLDERSDAPAVTWEIVGPVCESGDWLAHARTLRLAEGDLLAALSAGAYGMAMASNYNARGRAAEVLVDGSAMRAIRDRETAAQLFAGERLADATTSRPRDAERTIA